MSEFDEKLQKSIMRVRKQFGIDQAAPSVVHFHATRDEADCEIEQVVKFGTAGYSARDAITGEPVELSPEEYIALVEQSVIDDE